MLLVMGLATSTSFIYAIAPKWAIVHILGLPYDENFASNYFDQGHLFLLLPLGRDGWLYGRGDGCCGVQEILASPGRILLVCGKSWMVLLYVFSRGFANENTHGFFPVLIVDTIVSIWTIGYWIEQRSIFPDPEIEPPSISSRSESEPQPILPAPEKTS